MTQIEEIYHLYLANGQKFSTDSRRIEQGDIYFALKGANFNGNKYAQQAIDLGASYAVVDEVVNNNDPRFILVLDVLTILQELGLHHRRQFNIPIVAIAGSNGKTTTKELLFKCLQTTYRVHATAGNFNNHIGVPITLLRMPLNTEIGIIEIGTNAFGEIALLCKILEPDFGVITNIGKEHLEGFGDLEGVAKEESELYHFLQHHRGFAFINNNDPYLQRMSHRLEKKRSYGIDVMADDQFSVSSLFPELELMSNNAHFHSKLQGMHNAQNMAAAICIGRHFNISDHLLNEALKSYVATNNRSEWVQRGSNSFLLDAYNANPSSMIAAIDTFQQATHSNKVILLGDMFELGETSEAEHEAIALKVWSLNETKSFLVGDMFSKICQKHGRESIRDVNELIQLLKVEKFEDTWFLIKGSRGMKMELAFEAFSEDV